MLLSSIQSPETQSISFCGASGGEYPDPRGMGYPFDKTWDSRVHSTASVRDIVAKFPHIKLYDFKIQRIMKLYQGESHPPPPTVTWDNKIKGFFTEQDIGCMKSVESNRFDLSKKSDVVKHASDIYCETFIGDMPLNDDEKKVWAAEDRPADFKTWMLSGYP